MTSFGKIRPTLIARVTTMTVAPSAMVPLMSPSVAREPWTICSRPEANLRRKLPGSIETTEAKPIAANGMRKRRATG